MALTGAEMRACWTPPDAILEDDDARRRLPAGVSPADADARVPRTFVLVDELVVVQPATLQPTAATSSPTGTGAPLNGAGWSLWGDPEP